MDHRIVITGVGLTCSLGNNLQEFRRGLLEGRSGIQETEIEHLGKTPAGLCHFDHSKHSNEKKLRNGTRAGSIATYCAGEALGDASVTVSPSNRDKIGVYLGITEHGSVETSHETTPLVKNLSSIRGWSPYHMSRIISNAPAGEVCLSHALTGPHMTLGGACAAGNLGLIYGAQMLKLGEVDYAIAGGVSESAQSFINFASFKSLNALASHKNPTEASRPLDKNRNGIVVSEGGALFVLERLDNALKRKARIYGEIAGYSIKTDATSFTVANAERQAECMTEALKRAKIYSSEVDLINLHATGTPAGDITEYQSVTKVFGTNYKAHVNATKGHIGHCMGAAGSLEIAANILSIKDQMIHHCLNMEDLDPNCPYANLVTKEARKVDKIDYLLSNSFGMLGINTTVVLKKQNI